MTIARVKPANWAIRERLFSAQLNELDTNIAKAVDGVGGGEYEPSEAIRIVGTLTSDEVLAQHMHCRFGIVGLDTGFLNFQGGSQDGGFGIDGSPGTGIEFPTDEFGDFRSGAEIDSGVYVVQCSFHLTSDSNTSGISFQADLLHNGSTHDTCIQHRWSTNTAHTVHMSLHGIIQVDDPENDVCTIQVSVSAGTVAYHAVGADRIRIHRIK